MTSPWSDGIASDLEDSPPARGIAAQLSPLLRSPSAGDEPSWHTFEFVYYPEFAVYLDGVKQTVPLINPKGAAGGAGDKPANDEGSPPTESQRQTNT